jgi:hypothetical protein
MTRAALLCVAMAVAVAPACYRRGTGDDAPQLHEAILIVDNMGFHDMTIYVVKAGARLRIGVARGNGKTQFSLRSDIVGEGGEVQFLADPIGGNAMPISETIRIRPGDVVTMVIQE